MQLFFEYTKNALEESLRNFEERKSLDYISYRFEVLLLTVMHIVYTNIGPFGFIAALGQLLLEVREVIESLLYCDHTKNISKSLFLVLGEAICPSFKIGYDVLLFFFNTVSMLNVSPKCLA